MEDTLNHVVEVFSTDSFALVLGQRVIGWLQLNTRTHAYLALVDIRLQEHGVWVLRNGSAQPPEVGTEPRPGWILPML
jgi:hypothetical protein